jgi:hypothetical protein
MGMKPVPDELLHRPFSRAEARALGITDRMLSGRRFVRVLPTVFRHRNYAMTSDTWVTAARLALPARAQLTGITRIQQLGLDYGPRLPVRFVIEGDHHLALDQVFLHRTRRLPPTDDVGSRPPRRTSPTAEGPGSSTRSRSVTGCCTGVTRRRRRSTTSR